MSCIGGWRKRSHRHILRQRTSDSSEQAARRASRSSLSLSLCAHVSICSAYKEDRQVAQVVDMGVISVGASLGVKDDGNAHPIISSATATSPMVATRRRGASRSPASLSASASVAIANTRSSHYYPQQQYTSSNEHTFQQQSTNTRKKPLRRRATATNGTASSLGGGAATANTTASVSSANGYGNGSRVGTTNSSSNPTSHQDDMGQWQVTRMVTVTTNCDPQLLLPHVIGNRGVRINAIMSQAKCIIVYRKRDARTQEMRGLGSNGYAMSFQVSADTIKRVLRQSTSYAMDDRCDYF